MTIRHTGNGNRFRFVAELMLWAYLVNQLECLSLEYFTVGACLKLEDDIVKYDTPYHQCIDLCRGRQDCRATSFWPKMATCRLNMLTNDTIQSDQACVFSKKANWTEKAIAGCSTASCPVGMLCREECGRKICYDKDCPVPSRLENGEVLGSSTAVGSKMLHKCDEGFFPSGNSTRTCKLGGWSGVEPGCNGYLVSGPNGVPDNQLSASSVWDTYLYGTASFYSPKYSRLNTIQGAQYGTGSWSALVMDANQYIQVEFTSTKKIVAVALQGRNHPVAIQYVTRFKVQYATTCQQFSAVMDDAGNDKVFDGNNDTDTIVTRYLPTEVRARCVRINPVAWQDHISLRFDVIGRN